MNPKPDPLEALAHEAAGIDTSGAPDAQDVGPQQAEPAPLTNAQCLAMGLQIVRETVCAVAKVSSPKTTLDDGTLQTVADAIGPVLDKYGINLAGVAGDYMLELRAAMVTVPVILAARAALVEEIRAKAAKPVEPEGEAAPAAAT